MLPTRTLFEFWGQIWATTAPLQAIDNEQPKYQLIIDDFLPSLDLTVDDLTLETTEFNDVFAVAEDTGHGVDPINGDKLVRHKFELVPHYFVAGAGAVGKTVYGMAMIRQDSGALLATYKFSAPIDITRAGQLIDMPDNGFRLPTSMVR